jgi:hypothetical protein
MCLNESCCDQITACAANPTCEQLVMCIATNCADAPDIQACALQQCGDFLGGVSDALPILDCAEMNCMGDCNF